jgi:hypothetical protein
VVWSLTFSLGPLTKVSRFYMIEVLRGISFGPGILLVAAAASALYNDAGVDIPVAYDRKEVKYGLHVTRHAMLGSTPHLLCLFLSAGEGPWRRRQAGGSFHEGQARCHCG